MTTRSPAAILFPVLVLASIWAAPAHAQAVEEDPAASLAGAAVTPVPLTQVRVPAGGAKTPADSSAEAPTPQSETKTAAPKVAKSRAAPQPFPEFTFKRVAPPATGKGRRITVQIAPRPAAPAKIEGADDKAATVADSGDGIAPRLPAEWFWAAISPSLEKAAAHRFQSALAVLDKAPAGRSIAAPRLQELQTIARAHGRDILVSSIGTGVSPAFALAVIAVESAGRQGAVSPVGARGVMQLMPATAARFGVDPDISAENIRGGIAYLDWLLKRFEGDPLLALAGYNAGENAVTRHKGVPPFPETRAYVPKVLAAWRVARGLCLTPPELVSDGCVFAMERAAR